MKTGTILLSALLVAALQLQAASGAPGDEKAADSDYDVVVAGGTSYGVAAAVEAARAGKKVLVVAPRSALGEDLAGTLRLRPEDGAALPSWLRERLYAPNPDARPSLGVATPLQVKKALDGALSEAGVAFRCWLQPCDIAADADGRVTGLWVAGRDGRALVAADRPGTRCAVECLCARQRERKTARRTSTGAWWRASASVGGYSSGRRCTSAS